jgi:uncharacterized protein involved in copper resistance
MFSIVVFGVAGDEFELPLAFTDDAEAYDFARAAMFGVNVKKTLILKNGEKYEGFQRDENGDIETLIF